MKSKKLTCDEVLKLIPIRSPFLFVDRLKEINANQAIGEYTFKQDEFFYSGHFPGQPVTPGVILIEAMAQVGVISLGIFNAFELEESCNLENTKFLMTDVEAEFLHPVFPGDQVTIIGVKEFWRMGKLKASVTIVCDGRPVSKGRVSGIKVQNG